MSVHVLIHTFQKKKPKKPQNIYKYGNTTVVLPFTNVTLRQ